ncbi:MAG TPA: FtsX-like permease family protein [Mycobacteriales bacterium]|jgi:putative ABC transport system permease protein|nr:FtsX-like permease family protein [Mycobacteriales bacterium]
MVVRSQAAYTDSEAPDQRAPVRSDLVGQLRRLPGVATATGAVRGFALMVDEDGETIGAGLQANNGMSAPSTDGAIRYATGRAPAGPGEVAVDAGSAADAALAVGDRIRVVFQGPPREFTVVGVARFGKDDRLGSTSTALFDLETAQQVLGKAGAYDEVLLTARDGTSPAVLRDTVAAALPEQTEVLSAAAVADERTDLLKAQLSFINVFLLVFAGIAVFVGSFIIWNTFTILVAQRSRELALLRALGATRRQVTRSVLAEAVVVGLLASALGLGLGLLVAKLLVLMLAATGVEMTSPGFGMAPRTVAVSVLVGVVVTVLASLAPARMATRVAPIEALRDAAPGSYRPSRRRAGLGGLVTAVGVAGLAGGLFAGSGIALVGLGASVTFLGITTLLPLVARPAARLIGAPLPRLGGMPGKLARDNAMRNPRRTASTAAALMIGLAVVASVTVLATSLKASIGSDIERTLRGELVVQQVGGQGAGLSPEVARTVAAVPGVAAASPLGFGRGRVDGMVTYVAPVDPATVERVVELGVSRGTVASLADGGLLVHEATAEEKGWAVGDPVPVEWPQTGATTMPVAGIFTEKDLIGADYALSLREFDRNVAGRLDTKVLVKVWDGADVSQVARAVTTAARAFPDAEVLTGQELDESVSGQVDEFLLFVTALLLLAVFIALIGIVNTLALSVFERTREIGLLRAVGMTRRQVRGMVRWESAVIAAIGAVTGSVVGLGFGVALVTALEDEGVSTLAVPVPRLLLYVLAAALAGVLAALGPARRASNIDVLTAVTND